MDVTDDGLLQEIQHLSICFFLPPNGMFFIKRFLPFRDRLAFPLFVQFAVFWPQHQLLSTTDIVNVQNEIHYHYRYSLGSGVIASVREAAAAAAAAAALCLK